MSDESSAGTARYSDPITERGGWVGRGAVLYDTRDASRRPCCDEGGRCLAHVTGVFEETETGEIYYRVADGTWTTEEWVHGDDLLAIFEPAGWSVTAAKPTYLLTREHGVEDHHDLMTDGGSRERLGDRPDGPISGLLWDHKLRINVGRNHSFAEGYPVVDGVILRSYDRVEHPWMHGRRAHDLVARLREVVPRV